MQVALDVHLTQVDQVGRDAAPAVARTRFARPRPQHVNHATIAETPAQHVQVRWHFCVKAVQLDVAAVHHPVADIQPSRQRVIAHQQDGL